VIHPRQAIEVTGDSKAATAPGSAARVLRAGCFAGSLLLAACGPGADHSGPTADPPPVQVRLVTGLGTIDLAIDQARAPITAANFLRYVDAGHYDGGRFHRTVRLDNQPDDDVRIEVVQGGVAPPRAADDFDAIPLERTNLSGLKHIDGAVSMARDGPDTATSDFFICIGDQPDLDFGGRRNPDGQGFAPFGHVIRGMDVVRAIQAAPADHQTLEPPIDIQGVFRLPSSTADRISEDPDAAGAPRIIARARTLIGQKDFAAATALLQALTDAEPSNARALMVLGYAWHAAGEYERAIPVHLEAAEFEETAPRALYNAACSYARMGRADEAFALLVRVRDTNRFDLTQVTLDPDLESIRDDPRIATLVPGPEVFDRPFVEPSRILREWRGEGEGGAFGWIARNIGDVDGDGIADVTTSAPNLNSGGELAGKVYVFSGRTGRQLWTRTGDPGDRLGLGIEAAGDTNADGVPDVVAGAPGAGRAYVYSGRDGAILLTLEEKQKGELFGRKTADVGDIDRDGHADVLVGAPGNDAAGEDAGRVAIYSGRDGSILLELAGERAGDQFGSAAAGRTDSERAILVVGAPNAGDGQRGRVYVYDGLSTEPRFVIESDEQGSSLGGMFVSVVGDVDADGVADIYASDWSHGARGPTTGRIYVHSGRDGSRLLTLTGEAEGDGFGIGPADAGDVDGDGHADLIIGAWQHAGAAPSGGKVYLFSGRDGTLLRAWTSRVMGETFGFDATGMGDVDGDGVIDLLLTSGWSAVNGPRSGRMFVVSSR